MCETNKNSNHRISGSSIITYDIKKFSNRSEDVEMKCLSGIDNQIPAFGTWRRTLAFSGGGRDFSYKQDCNDSILRLGSNPGFVHSDSTLRGCNVALGSRCLKDSLEKNEMPTHHHYDPVFAGIMQRRRRREQRPRRQRTTFSTEQTLKLELEYAQTEYISRPRRFELAEVLSLTENQIKIWFQNRRAKEKRIEKAQIDQQLRNAGLGTQVIPCDFSNRYMMYGTYPWSYSSDTILTGHKDINLNSLKAQGGVLTDDEESDDAGEEEEGDDGGRIFCIIDDNKCDDYKFDESS